MKNTLGSFVKFLRSSKRAILLITITAVITLIIGSMISIWLSKVANFKGRGFATLEWSGVEAYWDENLTDKLDDGEQIDWGTLWVGSSNDVTIYLRSLSNIQTTLHLTVANLTFHNASQIAIKPTENISNHMNLNWNYDGSLLDRGDVIPVTLTLSAIYSQDFVLYLTENDVESFSLDIVIQTTEYVT